MNALRHPSVGENAIQLMVTFAQKVGRLDDFQHSIDDLDRAIRLYFTPNKQLFKKRAGELIRRDLGPSMEPASIDDALYSLLHIAFSPMIDVQADETWTEQAFTKLNELSSQKREAFDQFLAALETTQFLKNLQLDCLRLYAQMYRAEISLRPAIFLDLIASTDSPLASGRVSAKDFGSYKDLYREMCEIYARQLILAAGLNNLDSRDDHNSFPPHKHGNPLSSLDNFADKALAEKLKYLKGGWIPLNLGAVDPSLRNAIAHTTTEYDETTQMITFFAEKEGMKRERGRMISYLDFMRELLILFREMHALHQLIYLVGHRIHVWRANGSSE
ncbi:hypothetical protein XspCFBP7912_01690 [Xanthomonas sp. CFBP 7912]|nr:hypothetical protein XspCFBP7912_01690 [Xanthomonas sp. CFBP 7912]